MVRNLFIRFSSLGDVILSTASLPPLTNNNQNDFLTSTAYRELLQGHPRISVLHVYKTRRAKGKNQASPPFLGFARILAQENYHHIYDLHGSTRSRLLCLAIRWICFTQSIALPQFHTIDKQKRKLFGLIWFKSFWPKALLPEPWLARYQNMTKIHDLPDFRYLLDPAFITTWRVKFPENQGPLVCFMPASSWKPKAWPLQYFVKVAQNWVQSLQKQDSSKRITFAVFGTKHDSQSLALVTALKDLQATLPCKILNAIDWQWSAIASLLSLSERLLSNDTGIAHLSQALGTKTFTFYGPTTPEVGFGPWHPHSLALQNPLFCRPCTKDGSACLRLINRFACLHNLTPDQVPPL